MTSEMAYGMYEILRLLKKKKPHTKSRGFELSKLSCIFSHMTTQWAYGLFILRKLRFEKTHQCLRVVDANARFYDDVTRSNISLADETTIWSDSGS